MRNESCKILYSHLVVHQSECRPAATEDPHSGQGRFTYRSSTEVRCVSRACRGQSCWQLPDTETGTRHSLGFQRMKLCRWCWQLSHSKKRYWRIWTEGHKQVALHHYLLLCLDHCKCTYNINCWPFLDWELVKWGHSHTILPCARSPTRQSPKMYCFFFNFKGIHTVVLWRININPYIAIRHNF